MTRRRPKLTVVAPLLIGLILVLAFSVFLVTGMHSGSTAAQQRLAASSRAVLSVSTRLLSDPLDNLDIWTMRSMLNELLGEPSIVHAAVRDTTGQIVLEVTEDQWVSEEKASRDLAAQSLAQRDIVQREIENNLVSCGPIATDTEQIGTLEIAFDLAPLPASLVPMMMTMTLMAIALLLGVVLVAAVLARYATTPLHALASAADEIGRGNLDSPIPIRGMEETATLGIAVEHMRTDLQRLYSSLEQQIANLELRASYLEATARVARDATSVLDSQELLSRVVTLISEQLGFYHTGIFLLDPAGEWAVLHAASSEGGQQMLARRHRLRVGHEGIVGYVTGQGESCIALDVGTDAVFFDNPDLPDTRSEMALPLQARGEIIGALDVQSTEPQAFSDEDVAVLQTLADQVAVAISNARLFQQAQESLEVVQRAYGELSREEWAEMLRGQPDLGYYCDARGVTPVTMRPDSYDDGDLAAMSIPVTTRGGAIGTVSAHKPRDAAEWTTEEIALMETLTEQLGVALESARLYQDAQRRAARERLTREITDRMRRATDMEGIVQTAVDELFSVLGTSRAFVRLEAVPSAQDDGKEGYKQ